MSAGDAHCSDHLLEREGREATNCPFGWALPQAGWGQCWLPWALLTASASPPPCRYIERKAFLERVDHRQFEIERNIRLSRMKP